jgi:hypothetical protein
MPVEFFPQFELKSTRSAPEEFTTGAVPGLAPNFIPAQYNRLLAIHHYQSLNLSTIPANIILAAFTAPGLS